MSLSAQNVPDQAGTSDPPSRRAVLAKTIEATSSIKIDSNTAVAVRALVARSLFAQAPAYLAIESAAAALAAGVYFYLGVDSTVFAWLILSLAAIVVRWVHVYRYFERDRDAEEAAAWMRVFAFGALLSGSLWGVSSLISFSPDNPSLLVAQILVVSGLSALALTGYSVHAPSFYCFALAALVPFGARLMVEGTAAHTFVAIMLSIWIGVFVYLCHLLSARYFERTLFLAQSDYNVATRRAVDLADQANQAKTRFLANVSHELRTPLNAIIGFSDMIRSGYLGERGGQKYAEYIESIHQSGLHLKQLVDDVLDVSRIEMGRLALNEKYVDVGKLLRECDQTMRIQFERANIQLSMAFAGELPALYADPLRLKQIVLNLVTNALKFTGAGGEVWVTTGTNESGDMMIHVSDNGIGMKKEDIPKALLPFVQIADPPNKGDFGIGIGLYLVRVLVEAHEGTLMIHSEPARGTVVTIKFPSKRLAAVAKLKSALTANSMASAH